jgi:hypothetical protein
VHLHSSSLNNKIGCNTFEAKEEDIKCKLSNHTVCFSSSFDISLSCECDLKQEEQSQNDTALKLTARFSDRQFLRNACVSGSWTQQEASTDYFPFIPNQPFRVYVMCCY